MPKDMFYILIISPNAKISKKIQVADTGIYWAY